MEQLIQKLQLINFQEFSIKSYTNNPKYSEKEIDALKSISNASNNFVQDRLCQLASIARMMQVASQDDEYGMIGCFTKRDIINLSFFLEEEINNLTAVNDLERDAKHYLQQAMNQLDKPEDLLDENS